MIPLNNTEDLEDADDVLTAQLCRIKAFQPSPGYRSSIGKKTRNQLGKEKADAINSGSGWQELVDLFNQVEYRGQRVCFEPFKIQEGQKLLVTFDTKIQAISFPKLRYKLSNNEHIDTLSIFINPCISEGVRTKLITRPKFICTTQEFLDSPGSVSMFFDESYEFTDTLFDVIRDFYMDKTGVIVDREPNSCADLYIIGHTEFKNWVKFAIENSPEQIIECAKNEPCVSAGREVLKTLMDEEVDYKWFSRSESNTNAVYGMHGNDNYCKVLGIIDNKPSLTTRPLTQELIPIMDRNDNCESATRTS